MSSNPNIKLVPVAVLSVGVLILYALTRPAPDAMSLIIGLIAGSLIKIK